MLVASLTDSGGKQRFGHVIDPDAYSWVRDYPDRKIERRPALNAQIAILARSPGRISQLDTHPEAAVYHDGWKVEVQMPPATAVLQGRVTDAQGRPVAGATVSLTLPEIDDFRSARTDENGHYAITDAVPLDFQKIAPKADETAKKRPAGADWLQIGKPIFIVRHRHFAEKLVPYERIPATVDVVLEPGGVIEGRVLLADGKPAVGFPIRVEGTWPTAPPPKDFTPTQTANVSTDAAGRYRVNSLRPNKYRVFAEQTGWANPANNTGLTGIEVRAGQTMTAPDLVLQRAIVAKIQLINAATKKPLRWIIRKSVL